MTVPRILAFVVFSLWLLWRPLSAQEKEETFFAGTVVEFNSDKVTVSRVVLGKQEKRVFRITPDTKCEGKLKAKVRVTIRYVDTEDGETAELIIVRTK